MDIFEKKHNIKMQLWVVPGILFVCCILLAILLNSSSTPLVFPCIALIGMIASHLYTWRGVAISSAILMLVMFYFLQIQPSPLWMWTIALTLSIAATFVTTALCSDKAYHAWNTLKQDETDHRQTILHLNEKLQMLQNRPGYENKEAQSQIHILQEQLSTQEKQHRIDRDKWDAIREQQKKSEEKLRDQAEQHQLDQKKLQAYAVQLNEYEEKLGCYQEECRVDQEKLQILTEQHKECEEKLDFYLEQQQLYEAKQRAYEDKQRTHEQLLKLARHEVVTAYSNQEKLTQEINTLQSNYESLANEYEKLKSDTRNKKLPYDYEQLASKHQELEAEYQKLKSDRDTEQLKINYEKLASEYADLASEHERLKSEQEELQLQKKSLIDVRELRRIEGLYQQLRTQFEEKTEVLNATRKELFSTQEKLLAAQKDREEAHLKDENSLTQSLRQQLAEVEEERMMLERQYAFEVQQLHEIVDSLMRNSIK